MKKVLVLGDQITDIYRHFTATRICPEAPVQVLTKTKEEYSTSGGAGLVVAQLVELFNDPSAVTFWSGSHSEKERIFADGQLLLRIDEDAINPVVPAWIFDVDFKGYDAIVISDYDKGAFIEPTARYIILKTKELGIPVFVDAKKNWSWYRGAFAMFPNDRESSAGVNKYAKHIIHKLGPEGCKVDGVHIPTNPRAVRDCTGAGDCFLAAFVWKYLQDLKFQDDWGLQECARFANKVAGVSVEKVGTYIVTKDDVEQFLWQEGY